MDDHQTEGEGFFARKKIQGHLFRTGGEPLRSKKEDSVGSFRKQKDAVRFGAGLTQGEQGEVGDWSC